MNTLQQEALASLEAYREELKQLETLDEQQIEYLETLFETFVEKLTQATPETRGNDIWSLNRRHRDQLIRLADEDEALVLAHQCAEAGRNIKELKDLSFQEMLAQVRTRASILEVHLRQQPDPTLAIPAAGLSFISEDLSQVLKKGPAIADLEGIASILLGATFLPKLSGAKFFSRSDQ